MTRISKKELNTQAAQDIHRQFLRIITTLKGKNGAHVLEELFTETEQVMLAKRLAALLMLTQDVTPFHVSEVLQLSSSTTKRLHDHLLRGHYAHIETLISTKKTRERLWAELEVLIRFGMPEMGKGRWKWLDEIYKR